MDQPPTTAPRRRRARRVRARRRRARAGDRASSASRRSGTTRSGPGHLFDRAVAKVDRFLAGPVPERSAPVTVDVPGRATPPTTWTRRGRSIGRADGRRATAAPSAERSPPTPVPAPTATPDADACSRGRRRRHRVEPQEGLRPRAEGHLVRPGRRPDGPRHPRQGRHLERLPARAPGSRPRVGEPRGQPQRRLGTVGDGARPRRVRRAGLRGPRLQDAPGRPARRGQGDRADEGAGASCWRGAAPTPG